MATQDLGTLKDYLLNGDNYTRIDPATGNTLVIPGVANPGPSPLLAPNSECNTPDCYYPITPDCGTHPGFTGRCDLIVHDRITGWYHIAGFADFQTIDISCVCTLAQVLNGFTPKSDTECRAVVQGYVDGLAGQAIWGTIAPWLLEAMGLPRSSPFFPDFWFIACNDDPIVIPNLIIPKPPPGPPPGGPPPPIPPPGPPPPPQPPPPITGPCDSGDPDADQILDLCNALQRSLACLCQITSGDNAGQCCAQIIKVLGGIRFWIESISHTLQFLPKPSPPPDLAPIVAELQALVAAIAGMATPPPPDLAPLVDAVNKVAAAVGKGAATDVSGIVKALDEANTLADVPPEVIQTLQSIAPIAAQAVGLLQGSPFDTVTTVLEWLAKYDPAYYASKAVARWINQYWPDIVTLQNEISKGAQKTFASGIHLADAIFSPFVKALLNVHEAEIAGLVNIHPGDELTVAKNLLTEAISAGVGAHFAAVLGELLYPTKNLGFPQMAALMAELAGFGEITGGILGPEIKAKISIPHQYFINNQARSLLPGHEEAAVMAARGLIDQTTANTLLGYNNLSRDFTAPFLQGAYHGISARILLRLIEFEIFTTDEIRDELTFAGMRPASQDRMIKAAQYMGADPYRKQVQNALEAQYVAGLLDDGAFLQAVDSTRHTNDIDNLLLMRVQLERHTALTKQLEAAYLTEGTAAVIDEGSYQALLGGLGMTQDAIDAKAAILDARLKAADARRAAAAERALERATVAAERKAAVQAYKTGVLEEAGLTAALLLTGMTPVQTAAQVGLAVLQKKGTARYIYGLLKTPADAQLLRERVAALLDQRKKQLIDDAGFLGSLQALGIAADYQNSLLAAAAALTTPKLAITLVPVSTG